MKKWVLPLGLVFITLFMVAKYEPLPEEIQLKGATMGTYYSVKYLLKEGIPAEIKIQTEIDKRLELVNDQMSTYRKNSELSRFNQHTSTEPVPVSAATIKVIKEALRLHQLSDGALDITLGPLVNLWGFGPNGRSDKKPSAKDIDKGREMTGVEHLLLTDSALIKTHPSLYVDLSSIAKGFGVDVIANYLQAIGIDNYLVDIGGELQLKGVNASRQPWRIAIEKPADGQQSVQEIIAPENMAVATSGDYRNYFEENGVRYSHTIDPKTAQPIKHRLVSVTVLDKSCMTADGLATAFMVMGTEKAVALANAENIPAFFIEKTDNGFSEIASSAFKPYLLPEKK